MEAQVKAKSNQNSGIVRKRNPQLDHKELALAFITLNLHIIEKAQAGNRLYRTMLRGAQQEQQRTFAG
jgi:hypothetical protein